MFEIAELKTSDTLTLPAVIAGQFRPADRFIVWTEGDMLHLKRMHTPSVTELVAQAPEGEPLSLNEINELVHEVRRKNRGK
jgi:predicted transcriptional regulator